MGSVGDNHRCPLCGRQGNGGYHVDGWNCGPVCTGEQIEPGCLWRASFSGLSAEEILVISLDKVMCGRFRQWCPPETAQENVVAFLLR